MFKFNLSLLFALVFYAVQFANAQTASQNVKGRVADASGSSITGANITIYTALYDFEYGTTSREQGNYKIEVPVGRYRITISYTGYESITDELLVVAGRETIVNFTLTQNSKVLEAIEVSGASVDLPGAYSLSIEKTLRVPANFLDPVRVATAQPGVIASNDQNNAIIIRGNSPNGILWRLNDVDVVNPNHLANAGTLSDKPQSNGGGVNILSAQMLDRTNFYTGAFPSNYGNALSGIIDMRLREGNKEKDEYTAQASLIGLDVAAEGPFNKNKNSSYLINYRYSTVGLLSLMGVNFGDEKISFQDVAVNTDFNLTNKSKLKLFGIWGKSDNDFEAKEPKDWEEDKDMFNINYNSTTYAVGLDYNLSGNKSKFSTAFAYSSSGQARKADLYTEILPLQRNKLMESNDISNTLLSSHIKYEMLLGSSSLQIGVMNNYFNNDYDNNTSFGCFPCGSRDKYYLKNNVEGFLLQPYAEWNSTLTDDLSLIAGVRYLHFTYNNTVSIEPRFSFAYKTDTKSKIDLSYSLVSQMQSTQVYAINKDLGFTKAHHADLSYIRDLNKDIRLKAGVFYQSLFDVPIENSTTSTFSTLNLIEVPPAGIKLLNQGTGKNYGTDFTLERSFFAKHYFMVGGSYYESTYEAGNGKTYDTRFNGNYTFTSVYGREWSKPSTGRVIGLNLRALYLGGLRESSVDIDASEAADESVYNNSDPFNNKLKDYFRCDLRLSFRKDKKAYTRTFAIDIQNLLNQQNEAYHYYDFTQSKIITKYQLGIIPVLVYRIDF